MTETTQDLSLQQGPGEFALINVAISGQPIYWPSEAWQTESETVLVKLPLTSQGPLLRRVPRNQILAGKQITPRDHYQASLNMVRAAAA